MKTGLIAYRQVLRIAGFNYLKCCSSLMAEATSTEFSHIMQQFLNFKTFLQQSKQETSVQLFALLSRLAPRW